jgi:predicted O-methyltransferase YrrM
VLQDIYMPVSPDAGRLLYALARACRPEKVVEFDTSYESAAGYLAYVRDPGHGFVSVEFPVDDGIEISSWTGRPLDLVEAPVQ